MPAQEVNQPQTQQMEVQAQQPSRVSAEQPVRAPFLGRHPSTQLIFLSSALSSK